MLLDLDQSIKQIDRDTRESFNLGYCPDCLQQEIAIFPDNYKCMVCGLSVDR